MVATPLRRVLWALPAPARKVVRAARERVRTPKAKPVRAARAFSEAELSRFAEVMLRAGQMH